MEDNVPTSEEFKMELHRMMYEAMQQGRGNTEMTSGELHRRVGGYPGADHRMPMCCQTMRQAIIPDYGDVVLEEPPSGQGATLKIRYVVPRPEPS